VAALQSVGDVFLVGGAVRDVARRGVRTFRSDLDFVVHGENKEKFVRLMEIHGAMPNRFGGFGLQIGKLKLDAWHIEDTWARTAGIVDVNSPSDLLNCVFFDWDAILYDVSQNDIIAPPDYFSRIGSNVLDLCLEDNPNEAGSLVRAIRRGALWDVKFGSHLTDFAVKQLAKHQWSDLVHLDRSAFPFPVLRDINPDELRRNLGDTFEENGLTISHPIRWRSVQLELPFMGKARVPSPALGRKAPNHLQRSRGKG
jgi:hypothetical protein